MSKPWGGVGAWALDAERAEAEERERVDAAASDSLPSSGQPDQSFPSLKEAVKKPKKKKNAPLTLSEFYTGNYVGHGSARRESAFESKGLTHDEMIRLPTGPRERTAEELEQSRLGGGFRSYGYSSAPPRRRSEPGMDEEGRRGVSISRASDPDLPSRADEVDNWAAAKKFTPTMDSGRQERYGSLGSGGSSKADEVDNWSLGKKSAAPAPPPSSRNSGFRSGFMDSPFPGADSDRWARGSGGSFASNGERERPRLALDPPKRVSDLQPESTRNRSNPFGAARPREEVLADKGMDWRKLESEIEVKNTGRPTSSHSSRPTSAHSSRPESPISQMAGDGGVPKSRPKVNPFGDAKPREVLLEEKGMDWRKIDLELEHCKIERPVTDEERILSDEIGNLKKKLAQETENKMNSDPTGTSSEQSKSLYDTIGQREKELDQLARELDEKVRFGQRASSSSIDVRPSSSSGWDRPLSQPIILEDSRNSEFVERPRSRGKSDSWSSRPVDDRRVFARGRDSGFLAGRNADGYVHNVSF